MTIDQEVATHELTGAVASAAVERWFRRPRLTLNALDVTKDATGRIVIVVAFRRAPWAGYRVRITRSWALSLWTQLGKVLGK
jgi:hypothetical protein